MKKNIIIGLILATVVVAMFAGCTSQRVEQLSKMALHESDLPQTYALEFDKTEAEFGDVAQIAGAEIR